LFVFKLYSTIETQAPEKTEPAATPTTTAIKSKK
jgi:hypothetical protein